MKTKLYYDFHIHSCLSPCADNDMTPNNIAGMANINGLNIVALTDHNSCKNCPAFFEAGKRNGIVTIAGMELTTSEDIHMICIFPTLDAAMAFDTDVYSHLIKVKNRPDIFGAQLCLDGEDKVMFEEEYLLFNATDLSLEEAYALAKSYDGFAYPAHIDRDANGIINILGDIPPYPDFACVEFRDNENRTPYFEKYESLKGKNVVFSSDAHYLWDINEAKNYFLLDADKDSGNITARLFEMLRRKDG